MTAPYLAAAALLASAAAPLPGGSTLPADAGEGGTMMNVLAAAMMLAGVILLGFILIRHSRMRIARRAEALAAPRERIDRIVERASTRDDVHAAEAAIVDTAQRLAAQLDDKAERLEQLIAQADERIARLARDGGADGGRGGELDGGVDGGADGGAYGGADGPGRGIEPERRAPLEPAAVDPLTTAVYDLADRGRRPIDIARELDEQIGKVELILALRAR